METAVKMGEVDEVHAKDEAVLNGNIDNKDDNEDSQSNSTKKSNDDESNDEDVGTQSEKESIDDDEKESIDDDKESIDDEDDNTDKDEDKSDFEAVDDDDDDDVDVNPQIKSINGKAADIVHEIIDDDDEEEEEEEEDDDDELNDEETSKNGLDSNKNSETIELNDSGDGETDHDVMIIDEPKENGTITKHNDLEVIELDPSPEKSGGRRRSIRNLNKSKSYVENDKDEPLMAQSSEESDIEEILPQDPLAINVKLDANKRASKQNSTIVVKDTKRLVEIAAKSNSTHSGNKKEPTLVIIDTNSILSGRGPVPVNKQNSVTTSNYSSMLPMALPAQGMYPPNMRATITPIPLNSGGVKNQQMQNSQLSAPVLPTLTDDMFVVEAPSFIVPYVYEKPPVTDFKDFLKEVADKIRQQLDDEDDKVEEKRPDSSNSNKDDKDEKDEKDDDVVVDQNLKKSYSYFDSALGKFFIDIGFNLVQEYVQSDLLKQQKRKRDREGGQNPTTNKTIHSLIKNLEFSKENNVPFRQPIRKCEFCNFKTESALVLSHHLETPHTKNYVYKCNFCAYEARSPHDILFHMEAEHAVRARMDRAPSFHQCPNCPFEDNQKGKLSRHSVACARKFKPEKNLDPPIDWEPPAKIPRVPKARHGVNMSAYQAMKSNSQLQFLTKMQLMGQGGGGGGGGGGAGAGGAGAQHPLHRGRGRPSLGSPKAQTMIRSTSGMVYKQAMSGGSVLVPTNYQMSGNQVFQQNQSKSKSVHQPSISITPLPRSSSSPTANLTSKPGDTNSKNSFVICEICDGYIKDLEQLRNHMQWIHKVKIHPKMIYNRPPLNCQKCQFRFFTDQGLERHLLGSHGLVTSSMQDAANKSKDSGRCPVCGRVYQWKLLNHVARDHNMTLKPAHLSYKCTVCTATFGMYKQFENHVYSAHSVVAKRVMDKKPTSSTSSKNDQLLKPLKINDEITIIPQPAKVGTSKDSSPSMARNSTPSTSKSAEPNKK